MAHGMTDIVLVGKETTRGTLALTFPLHQPFVGDGLTPTRTQHIGGSDPSSAFPSKGKRVPLGMTSSLALTPEINIATVRDLIDMATRRVTKKLTSFSIKHSQAGISDEHFLGCVVSQLAMEYSRSGSPDDSSLLSGTINFECMENGVGAGVVAGVEGAGRQFNLAKATITIDGVTAFVLSYSRSMTIAHGLGALSDATTRKYLNDGLIEESVNLRVRTEDAALIDLIRNGTEHNVTIKHSTGVLNEDFTETMGTAQIATHGVSKEDGELIADITIEPGYTGAADATVWSYGSVIGASVLLIP